MLIVLLASVLFVNSVEYLGCRLRLSSSLVGAIISPLFTSFPELMVFLIAVFVKRRQEIGIGTIFGQPFIASSLSYLAVGVASIVGLVKGKRSESGLKVDRDMAIPYAFITALFPLTLLPKLLDHRVEMGLLFISCYIVYVAVMSRRGKEVIEEAEDLYLNRLIMEEIALPMQLLTSVILLYLGSDILVCSIRDLARSTGIGELALSLLLAPIATTIPETATAVIWAYKGKDTLSLGSLVGEMILYSTFYPGIGLLFTSWTFDYHAYISVAATTVISMALIAYIRRGKIPVYVLWIGIIFLIAYALLL